METKKLLTAVLIASMALLNAPAADAETITERKTVPSGSSQTFENVSFTVEGASAEGGGALFNEGNAAVNNAVFRNNSASNNGGGAVYNAVNAEMSITNSFFYGNRYTKNSSTDGGGAVYNAGNLTINNTKLGGTGAGEANSGKYGGSIFNAQGGTLNILNNSVISGSTGGSYGGGIYTDKNTTLNLTDSVVSNNSVTTNGGGISTAYTNTSNPIYVNITNSSIINNISDGGAGGIRSYASLVIDNSIISGNKALSSGSGSGGGVADSLNMHIKGGSQIINNYAESMGGGIYISSASGIHSIIDAVISGNTANYNASSSYQRGGGGIFVSSGALTIENTKILDNKAPRGYGGGINHEAAKTLTITGGEISGNSALHSGGGIYQNSLSADSVITIDGTKFDGNTAAGAAAIALFSQGANVIRNSEIINNISSYEGAEAYDSSSGALFLGSQSKASIENTIFKDNKSNIFGGAIAMRPGSMPGSTEKNNNSGAKLDITGSSFISNKSGTSGGAIYNTFYSSNANAGFVTIDSSSFTSNSAAEGGALYNSGYADNQGNTGAVYISDSSFNNNTASALGGAVYNAGKMTIAAAASDVLFSGNTAGGIANDIYNSGVLTLNAAADRVITLNGGIEGSGGGSLSLTGAGTVNAGGLKNQPVSLVSGTLNLLESAAANNSRITVENGAKLTSGIGAVLQNGSITGENAYGGAVYNKAGGTAAFGENTNFEGNSAYMKGGAVYNAGTMTIGSGSSFTGNKTTWDGASGEGEYDYNSFGGAIWNSGTLLLGDNITFTDNKGSQQVTVNTPHGSDIYSYSGNITIGDNLKISRTDDYSASHDCSIYVRAGSLTIGDNASISGVIEGIITSGYAPAVTIGDNLHISDTYNGIANWGGNVNIGRNALFENNKQRVIQTVWGDKSFTIGDNAVFRNNTQLSKSDFSTIHNDTGSSMHFLGSSTFENNKDPYSNPGLFQNRGTLTFDGKALFDSNMSISNGGALRNRAQYSAAVFNDKAVFSGNAVTGSGAAIENQGRVIFNDTVSFINNIAGGIASGSGTSWTITGADTASAAKGGAVFNNPDTAVPEITFNADVIFTGNKAGYGGALYNTGTINFNKNAAFSGNSANFAGNDIYNTGTINFNAADDVTNTISLEGGIDGVISGIINIAGTGENKTGAADIQGSIHNQTVNVNSGTLHLSSGSADGSNLTGSTVSVYSGAVINTIDGLINTYNQTGSLITLSSGAKAKLEADLASGTADCFASSGGTVYVNSLNVLSDFTSGSKTLNIADTGTNINIDAIASADAEGVRRLYTTGGIYKIEGGDGVINVNFLGTGGINAAVESTTEEGAVQTISYSMTGTEYYNSDATSSNPDDTTVQKAIFTIEGNGNTIQAQEGTLGLKNDGNSTLTINNAKFTNFIDAAGAVENEAGGVLNLNNVVIGESNTAGIGNAGTLNAENSFISEVTNTGTANFNEGSVLSAVNNKAGGTANLNSGAIAAAIENEAGGALNINEGASAGAVINEGALTIKIVDYVNEAQTVNTMISNASGDDTSGSTAIDLQLSDHSALESDGVEWNLGSNGLNQKYLTFTGDGHLILTGGDITAESITNKMTGNTLVIDSIEVHGNVENISTGHMALTNGSYTEGSIKNDGTFDIYNGTFTVSSNGITDAAQTGAAGILNIGNGLDSTAVSLAAGGSIVQNALNISNAASLTSKLSALTIGSGDINNAGTLTLTDNGAGALNYNLLGASGRTVFNIGSDNTIAYDMTSKTITNAIELQSGTFKASNGASGYIDLSSAAGITAKGGVLNVQDGNFGTIKLGSLDTSSSALNVEMDLDWTGAGAADVLSADITGDKGINIKSFDLKTDADIAASSILIADDTIDTSKISVGSASVKNNTTVNGLALSTSYTAGTGTSLIFSLSTLKDAIAYMTGDRTYTIVTDASLNNSAGTLNLSGNALSISACGKTITAASADNNGISIASGKTLSIDNAVITGFTNSTAIENAGTLNLDTVTFTGNKTDIDNTGALNVINSVTASVNNAGSISGAGTLNLAGNSTNTGSIASAVSMAAGSTLTSSGNISGNINNTAGGNLDITGGLVSGNIDNTGAGALAVSGGSVSGSIDISNNTSASALLINGGTVSGSITNDNAVLALQNGSISGAIAGSAGNQGAVDIIGNGIISGAMTYQDITVNSGAVLTPLGSALASSTNTLNLKNNSALNLADGSFNVINTPISSAAGGVSNLMLDIDLISGASDRFTDTSNLAGMVNLSNIKLDESRIPETGYNGMSFNLSQMTGIGAPHISNSVLQGNILTPIRYLQGSISNGMLNYVPTGGRNDYESFNPAVVSSAAAAQAGGYLVQLNSYENAFANVDMFMLMPQEQRQAYRFKNKYAASDSNLVFDPLMKMQEKKALWVRPFASFENVPLKNGPKVHNNIYGTFIGGDSPLYDLGRGWDGMFSVYAAYNGSHQSYNGISMYQNGGTLGVMGAAYKNNFFAAATVNAGANAADASTQYGSEDFAMLTAGAAVKAGYNYELFGGKFIIQPNMQASYSFVNTFNYKNAAGVRIKSDPLHAIQLEPGIKFIGNLKNGWQPYAGVSVVWNILDESNVKANDVSLPEMSVKPFVKYGIGVRKTWGERFTGFLQAGFTSGGRNGAGFQFGFRWALGK